MLFKLDTSNLNDSDIGCYIDLTKLEKCVVIVYSNQAQCFIDYFLHCEASGAFSNVFSRYLLYAVSFVIDHHQIRYVLLGLWGTFKLNKFCSHAYALRSTIQYDLLTGKKSFLVSMCPAPLVGLAPWQS